MNENKCHHSIITLFWQFQDGDFLIFTKCSLCTHFVLRSVLGVEVKMLLENVKNPSIRCLSSKEGNEKIAE